MCIIFSPLSTISSSPSHVVQHCNCIIASCYDSQLTASSEFRSFNTLPLSFFLSTQCTRMSYTNISFISILIPLSRDIQFNPGPVSCVSSLNMCTFNISCFTNPHHYTTTADLADNHNIDVSYLNLYF